MYVFAKNNIQLNQQRVLSSKLIKQLTTIHKDIMHHVTFSRFKYYISDTIYHNNIPSSKLCIQKFKEGNCVAFAYHTKTILHKLGFTDAVIVGAKPPSIFKRTGYLHVSHAAVVLPFNEGFILFDSSFYIPTPVFINILKNETVSVSVKNVYSSLSNIWYFTYHNDTDKHSHIHDDGKCIIPKNTPYIKVTSEIFKDCIYYLRELLNPDESITVHTNNVDKRIFYCKITPQFDIDIYYAIDLNSDPHILRGKAYDVINIKDLNLTTARKYDVIKWISQFNHIYAAEKRKMKKHIYSVFNQLYNK